MRGQEKVAKASGVHEGGQEQERGCFVYCFSGPRDVRELELSVDAEGRWTGERERETLP